MNILYISLLRAHNPLKWAQIKKLRLIQKISDHTGPGVPQLTLSRTHFRWNEDGLTERGAAGMGSRR